MKEINKQSEEREARKIVCVYEPFRGRSQSSSRNFYEISKLFFNSQSQLTLNVNDPFEAFTLALSSRRHHSIAQQNGAPGGKSENEAFLLPFLIQFNRKFDHTNVARFTHGDVISKIFVSRRNFDFLVASRDDVPPPS